MKVKRIISVLISILFLLCAVSAAAESKELSVSALDQYVYDTDTIRFNNFTISEGNNMFTDPDGFNHVKIQVSGRNKTNSSYYVQLQIAGFGHDGTLLWAMKVAPTMGILSEKSLEQLSGTAWVRPDTLSETKKIRIIYAGDFLN